MLERWLFLDGHVSVAIFMQAAGNGFVRSHLPIAFGVRFPQLHTMLSSMRPASQCRDGLCGALAFLVAEILVQAIEMPVVTPESLTNLFS